MYCAFPQTEIPLVGSITAISLHALFSGTAASDSVRPPRWGRELQRSHRCRGRGHGSSSYTRPVDRTLCGGQICCTEVEDGVGPYPAGRISVSCSHYKMSISMWLQDKGPFITLQSAAKGSRVPPEKCLHLNPSEKVFSRCSRPLRRVMELGAALGFFWVRYGGKHLVMRRSGSSKSGVPLELQGISLWSTGAGFPLFKPPILEMPISKKLGRIQLSRAQGLAVHSEVVQGSLEGRGCSAFLLPGLHTTREEIFATLTSAFQLRESHA
ncbi:uncharacterized protein LOC113998183 [Pipra filicauda]|uniref:Uncharacterized protein LOC113998183 n=1 Tax=Pipra filicauda TaxID=649802 RepID=A0A7R5KUI0_9PASS|nr:uncharacterized protein LOC113998183 [Pipra filicauda]